MNKKLLARLLCLMLVFAAGIPLAYAAGMQEPAGKTPTNTPIVIATEPAEMPTPSETDAAELTEAPATTGSETALDATPAPVPTLLEKLLACESFADFAAIFEAVEEWELSGLTLDEIEKIEEKLDEFVLAEEARGSSDKELADLRESEAAIRETLTPLLDALREKAAEEAAQALYESLMAIEDAAELTSALEALTEEEIALLGEERLNAVLTRLVELMPAQEAQRTVNFTDAGPFLPAVTVAGAKGRLRVFAAAAETDNGLVLGKSVAPGGTDGAYTIRLEAYATGETSLVETSKPADIVLVLDQSGSMAYDFAGETTSTNTARRQYAMKQAVNTFIDDVANRYSAQSDHRIAIVTYGSAAATLRDLTFVDAAGQTNLKSSISDLPDSPSGATRTDSGMNTANGLINTSDGYSGSNTERQKVVILFTDGVPSSSINFDTGIADDAIATSKLMKAAGITVYSVGIFNGADPTQLYGDKWEYLIHSDIPCTGSVGSYWGGSWAASLFGGNDFESIDVPAGNRFLNYLSTNFSAANKIGIARGSYNPGGHWASDGTGYKITENCARTDSQYYLTAEDTAALNTIFKNISQQIGGAINTTLTAETTIRDTVTPYFNVPTGTDAVRFYTAPCTGTGLTFGTETVATGVTGSFDGRTLTVSGFDFSGNWCGDHSGIYDGKKLIVEFTVSVREGFLGGNGVETNEGITDGLYAPNGVLAERFEARPVDVPIPDITVSAVDKNVYLTNTLSDAQLLEGASASAGTGAGLTGFTLDAGGTQFNLPTGDHAWKAAFVTLATTLNRAGGGTAGAQLMADGSYTLSVTLTPNASGTVGARSQTSDAANINVFKPVLTFQDSAVWYGGAEPAYNTANKTGEVWKRASTSSTAVVMTGDKPALGLTYTPKSGAINGGIIVTRNDIPVAVAVKIGTMPINSHTTFVHTACTPACAWETLKTNNPSDPAFLLHPQTCTLKITKAGCSPLDNPQNFLFGITGGAIAVNLDVAVSKNGTATIKGLPVGTYSVTEQGGWSWRYMPGVPVNGISLNAEQSLRSVTITNERSKLYWLSGDCYSKNKFAAAPAN